MDWQAILLEPLSITLAAAVVERTTMPMDLGRHLAVVRAAVAQERGGLQLFPP
jgi:hypothetical protein